MVIGSRARQWFGNRGFGLDRQETFSCSPIVIESIARDGGFAYRIPAGKRTLTDGEKEVVVESLLDTILFVPKDFLRPRYAGEAYSQQLRKVQDEGDYSILTPYEVAVMYQYREGSFFSGRIRTSQECAKSRQGPKLLTLRAYGAASLFCEGILGASRAPDIGVLAGLRIPVPVSGRLPVAA